MATTVASTGNGSSVSGGPVVSAVDYVETKVAIDIYKYFAPIIISVGLIGNSLAICVLSRGKVGKLTTSTLLIALAVADTCALLTGLLRFSIKALTDPSIDVRHLSGLSCPIHTFFVYFSVHMAVWILVLVTIERFISVIFPVKAKTLCTQPRMLAALACVFTILLLVDGHLLYGVRSNVDEVTQKVTSCTHVDGNYRGFWNQEWVWIDLCVLSIVPFFVILICNIMIISKVRVSQKSINKLRSTNPGHGKQPESVSKVTNMTAMLLTVNFVFLITTLPSSIYLAFWTDLPVDLTDHELAIHDLVFSCVNVWTYVSNAINFLLYCVSGPRFREQFVALFKRARVQPSNEETYENEQPNHRPRSASSDAFTKAIPNGIDRSNTRSVFLVDSSNV